MKAYLIKFGYNLEVFGMTENKTKFSIDVWIICELIITLICILLAFDTDGFVLLYGYITMILMFKIIDDCQGKLDTEEDDNGNID